MSREQRIRSSRTSSLYVVSSKPTWTENVFKKERMKGKEGKGREEERRKGKGREEKGREVTSNTLLKLKHYLNSCVGIIATCKSCH